MRILFFVCLLLISAQVSAQEKVFNATTFKLENGMDIIVIPNKRVPVVTHMVWYRAGAAQEIPGKSGIAHFLEHLLFKGSTFIDAKGEKVTLEPGEFSKIVKSLGGQDNAFTGQDYTAYFQSIAKEHLETVMRMEAGRMRGAMFAQEHVISERLVILEERRQRIENNPRAKFDENMDSVLFVNHPYSIPVIGWMHEMEALSRQDAFDYYNRFYYPNHAILVIAGDVNPQDVLELAQAIYGTLPKGPDVNVTLPIMPNLPGEISMNVAFESVKEPLLQVMMLAPSYNSEPKDSYALQVLEHILSGGSSSRLYKSLVFEQNLASSVGFSYSPVSPGVSQIWLYGVPMQGVSLERLRGAIEAEISKIVDDGVSVQEVSQSISSLQDQAIFALDSLSGPAILFGQAASTGTSLEHLEFWPERIAQVSAADVQHVAKRYLDMRDTDRLRIVNGYLKPAVVKNDTDPGKKGDKEATTDRSDNDGARDPDKIPESADQGESKEDEVMQ